MGQQKYIVIDYTDDELTNTDQMPIHLVDDEEMLEWIEKSHKDGLKIAIYTLGKCLLDWS